MSAIREKLAKVNDGRNHALGESTGNGYLGGLGEHPVTRTPPVWERFPRYPEKDTEHLYAFKTGETKYTLVLKTKVDA